MKTRILLSGAIALAAGVVFADGIVPEGTLNLDDAGSSGAIAEWTLDGDFTAASDFTIGGSAKSYNRLTVNGGQTFAAQEGMIVGHSNGGHNYLTIEENGTVGITGDMRIGTGNVLQHRQPR